MQLSNSRIVCGLDEAGRGAFAGPLVAAAVIIKNDSQKLILRMPHIDDGKRMQPGNRVKILDFVQCAGIPYAIEKISAHLINRHGIGWANKEIFRRLIRRIRADLYIIDGNQTVHSQSRKQSRIRAIVKADATIIPVMLAGIIAKVERDALMQKLAKVYSVYSWSKNKGYGTLEHIECIEKYGITSEHRLEYVRTAFSHKAEKSSYLFLSSASSFSSSGNTSSFISG